MPLLKRRKELQRFLGTINYYRCYVKDLSQIAQPLYALLKKGKPWEWDKQCRDAFDQLRRQLVNEHITLAHPDWKADASLRGVAVVLSSGGGLTAPPDPQLG